VIYDNIIYLLCSTLTEYNNNTGDVVEFDESHYIVSIHDTQAQLTHTAVGRVGSSCESLTHIRLRYGYFRFGDVSVRAM